MATTEQLKEALKETLEARGVLGKVRAELRAEIYAALDDTEEKSPAAAGTRIQQPPENFLVNELIREYLEFNGYKHAASVLVAESNQPRDPLPKDVLAREILAVPNAPEGMPLLYRLVCAHRANPQPIQSVQESTSSQQTTQTPTRSIRR